MKAKKFINANLLVIALLFFLFSGIFLIGCAAKLQSDLPNHQYQFEVSADGGSRDNRLYLNDFQFGYNFATKKGAVFFSVNNNNAVHQIAQIQLRLPKEINNNTIIVYILENISDALKFVDFTTTNFTYVEKLTGPSGTSISFMPKRIYNEEQKNIFKITFEGELIPSGTFYFYKQYSTYLGYGENGTGQLQLDLDTKYSCLGSCISRTDGFDLSRRSSSKHIELFLKDQKDPNFSFDISALNSDNIFLQNLLLGIGVSLSTAALLTLIQVCSNRYVKKAHLPKKRTKRRRKT